jgi:asparagine synthase (glutamine-hydrolysing)
MNYKLNPATFDEAKEFIKRELFNETARLLYPIHTCCDPIHILLSGGLDSCITLYCLREHYRGRIISHTLNYAGTWEGKDTDVECARKLSEIYGTEHYEHIVTEREMREDFPDIVKALGLPFAGHVSPYFAAKMLPENMPVFTGDLSDELFGSYKGPREVMSVAPEESLCMWRYELEGWNIFLDTEKEKLYSDKMKSKIDYRCYDLVRSWMPELEPRTDRINAMLGFDWVSVAPDQVFYSPLKLMRNEGWSPFMSPRLIDYVTALPGEYKVRSGNVKHILKETFRGAIPDFVIERQKEGFVQPSNHWLFHNWQGWVRDILSDKCMDRHGLWNKDYVHGLVDQFYNGDRTLQYKVWVLFCFQMWWNECDHRGLV